MFEIGNSLREARERQGLEYPQIELATKIRAKYIRALEDEHFDVLPTGTYIKGFLRSYAEFLGLDGQLYVDEYNSRNVVDSFDDMPQRRPVRRHERSVEKRVVLLALAGIAALTGLVIVAWRFGGGGSATPPAIVTQQRPAAPSGLRFVGLGKGTYLEVRRRSAAGHGSVPCHHRFGRSRLPRPHEAHANPQSASRHRAGPGTASHRFRAERARAAYHHDATYRAGVAHPS